MNLNPQQQQAVATNGRRVLVLAGPGAGKTRVITERVRHLVAECGVSGHNILLLTFTRRAAAEMESRITEAVGEREARKMWIGTFHATGLRILREYGEKLGYKPDTLTVYDECDQRDMLNDIIATRGAKIKKGALDTVLQAFGTRGWHAIDEYRQQHPTECAIFDEYRMRLRENNALDYGLILAETQRLIAEHADVRAHYHDKFNHVLVDEYQDTDRLQYNLHTLFDPEYLFCVGDSDQAIYSFRGATLDVLLDFSIEHFDAETIELPLCYRCGHGIVAAANALIGHNQKRIAKTIEAATKNAGRVIVETIVDTDAEAAVVVSAVIKNVNGCSWKDIAVLSRTRRWLWPIANSLRASGVPVTCVEQERDFYGRDDVKLFHALMSLVVNNRDNMAFMRVRRTLGIADDAYAQIRLRATQGEQSHMQACETMLGRPLFAPDAVKVNGMSLRSWTDMLLQTHGLEAARDELVKRIAEWGTAHGDDIHEYLLWLQQRDIQDELVREEDTVKLMTIHGAKGLEFKVVIIVGAVERHLPIRDGDELEEERRLMYVALTRAKEAVVVTVPKSLQGRNGQIPATPSRFIAELTNKETV